MKTIDIQAKEWFDKVNGNSYFAGSVTVDYGMPTQQIFNMPFQYGYGDHYRDIAYRLLQSKGVIKDATEREQLWQYAERNNIIVRYSMQRKCKQRELKAFNE